MKIKLIDADPNLAELFYEYRQDPETQKYNPLVSSDIGALRKRLTEASSDLSEYEKAEAFFWFVQAEEQIVGNVTLQNINSMMQTAEIGYGTFANARGRGVATGAIIELTKEVFNKTPLRKLIAYVHELNEASIKVLIKAGYQKEGLLREHYLIHGKPVNELIFGILRHDILKK